MIDIATMMRRRRMGGARIPPDFVFIVATSAAIETMTIPCQNIGVFAATIDWGDGSTSTITTYNDANLAHVYATAGTYTITISGQFPNVYFYGDAVMAAKVRTVESLGVMGWLQLSSAFRGCGNMTAFNGGGDISGVNSLFAMFTGCPKLVTMDANGWNTSNVTSTGFFLWNAFALTYAGITGWDYSSVNNSASTFRGCGLLPDIPTDTLDVSNVTTMQLMLAGVTLPTSRYDATLLAWAALSVKPNIVVDFGLSKYTLGGAAAAARTSLIANDLWTITDGGGV